MVRCGPQGVTSHEGRPLSLPTSHMHASATPQLVRAGAGAVNRSRALPKARVTARVRLHERVSRRDEPTSRVGICSMSRSFGTLVQLKTLLQVCTKLGLTRDGRMPDLGSDQGARQKASELRARRGLPDCSHYHRFSSWLRTFRIALKLHWAGWWQRTVIGVEGSGERRKFSPGIPEVTSAPSSMHGYLSKVKCQNH